MNKIKPCPFCGSTAHIEEGDSFFVFCDNPSCTADGPWDLGESGAIEKWNTRYEPKDDSDQAYNTGDD